MRPFQALIKLRHKAALAEVTAHLAGGGDPRAHDNTAARWACYTGRLDILERLIAGTPGYPGLTAADLRADNAYALRAACHNGHAAVVRRLVAGDLGLTAADARADDNAALRSASFYGYYDIVVLLFELDLTAADARACDNEAFRMACGQGHLAVAELFIERGLGAADGRALVLACEQGCLPVVERLIKLGQDTDDVEWLYDSYALQIACEQGHPDVVARLLEFGVAPTPAALAKLCRRGCVDYDTAEWQQRLCRAIGPWYGSPELAAAERALSPYWRSHWGAVGCGYPVCGLDYAE